MKKIMLILTVVLMLGLISAADRTLYYTSPLNVPGSNIAAGSEFKVDFEFAYLDDHVNPETSPLIIRLNFTSENENYPVWRDDFKVSGHIEKYALWGMIPLPSVYFECNNSKNQLIEHPLDAQTVIADNGTFYCYNAAGDLELEEGDGVFLDVISNYALYPGEYNLEASMFYLTDERAPFVNITNKDMFDKYYRENDNVFVNASINDGTGVNVDWSSVMINGAEVFRVTNQPSGDEYYYYSRNTPVDIVEDNYDLFVFAEDGYGNRGNDSVTLKIDRTAPEIQLTETGFNSVYGENDSITIEAEITDEKAGLNSSSVMYRISEIVNGSFCPDSGVLFGDYECYNSGWVSAWNLGDFKTKINISDSDFVSGSYYLEISACDLLDNCGVL